MNLLVISPNSPYESIGGVERYITNLIKYCEKCDGLKTVVMLPTSGEDSVITRGNVMIYKDTTLGSAKLASAKQNNNRARNFAKRVEEIVEQRQIEVICAENFHLGLPAAFSLHLNMIAGLHNIPLALKLHSFPVSDLQVQLVNQLMWKKVSCVSKSVAGDCFQKGTDINVLSTDYLGVDTNEFNPDISPDYKLREKLGLGPENRIILTATRILQGRKSILKEKGIINLIQAFSKISPRYPNLRLLIAVGKPPENLNEEFEQSKQMLNGYLKLNHVDEKTIVRLFPLEEMPDVYREADIFALPSENETFGQVFIEAMASGTPVIGTKVGGIPEIISDSYSGFLVTPNDSSELAQSIESLLKDKQLKERIVNAGLKTVREKFTAESQFAGFVRGMQEIIEYCDE